MPSKSKSQQRFFGIVRGIQKGTGKGVGKAKKAAKDMDPKDVEDFAKTKHKGLPNKVKREQRVRELIRKMVREMMNEGFAGALKKEDRKKFDDIRRKQSEVLGYTLTGKDDIKTETDDATIKEGLDLKKLETAIKDFQKKIKKQGRVTNARDEDHLKQLIKVYKQMGGRKIREAKKRDYKAEYKKYGSSKKAKKYRAELNKYNRQKGTYGNGDGKDASHKGGKIAGFEKESVNRGRREKSRLKKEIKLTDLVPKTIKEAQEPLWDKDSVKNVIKQIQKGIKVPYADGLGLGALSRRDEHPTIIGKISVDKKKDWPNGYIENSRWALVTIYPNGVVDTVRMNGYGDFKTRKKVPVLRKSKNKSIKQIIDRLGKYFTVVRLKHPDNKGK